MIIVDFKNIVVAPNRQRREFSEDAIAELARSIQSIGLLHPIIGRKGENDSVILVAGERRLRALSTLLELDVPIRYGDKVFLGGMLPVNLIEQMTPEQAFEAELEENIVRVDLTWQERATAIAKLHEYRTAQNPAQTIRATASEIAARPANNWEAKLAAEDLRIHEHLADANIAKASSRKEALKLIEKKAKVAHRAKLAEAFTETTSVHTLHRGDSMQLLATLPEGTIDCILTDPPYGMDATNFGSNFSATHDYEDSWEYFTRIATTLVQEAFILLKPDGHFYSFCSLDGFIFLKQALSAEGFRVWPQPLIWAKGNGNAPWVTEGHKKTYECIIFATKGHRQMTTVKSDVLQYPTVSDRDYAPEKPVDLLADLLERSTSPGDTVLDPFCGSGSIFPAADKAQVRAVGIEMLEEAYNIALTKL